MREAFELALDREGIVQVAMDGEADVGNQWVAPDERVLRQERSHTQARRRARQGAAGRGRRAPTRAFTLVTPTTSDAQKIAQIVQAMVKDAGFDVKIQSTEFATSLDMADKGDFEAYVLAWSGRADPDGNLYSFDACKAAARLRGHTASRRSTSCSTRSRSDARHGRAQEDLRADRRASCSRTGRSSICITATGCGRTPTSFRACARSPTGWCGCRD